MKRYKELGIVESAGEFIALIENDSTLTKNFFTSSTRGLRGMLYEIKENGEYFYTLATGCSHAKRINIHGFYRTVCYYRHIILTEEGRAIVQGELLKQVV